MTLEDRGGPLPPALREALEGDKALVLRSIKELEFDRAMGKVSESDFAELSGRLRARAVALIEELDRYKASESSTKPDLDQRRSQVTSERVTTCGACSTPNDADARFCKACGAKLS